MAVKISDKTGFKARKDVHELKVKGQNFPGVLRPSLFLGDEQLEHLDTGISGNNRIKGLWNEKSIIFTL